MCYLARHHQTQAEGGADTPQPRFDHLRPRWVGAAAVSLIGAFALAALVTTPSTAEFSSAKEAGAPARIASSNALLPAATGEERVTLPADDGVAASTESAKAGLGHCDHAL